MTDAIIRGSVKVFAILILIKQENRVSNFLEHYLHSDDQTLDSQLPLSLARLEETLSHLLASEFEEQQWIFLAPVFNQRLLHRNIPTEFPLPFIQTRKLGEGGVGDVYKTTIPAGHHNFEGIDSAQPACIVRKELRKEFDDGDLWSEGGSDEHKVLSNLHYLRHPNIIQLFTSYTYGGIPSFLLPFAEHGDLELLLRMQHRPDQFKQDRKFYAALSGLSSALETLHDYKSDVLGKEMIGYHHDLKPKNVLVSGSKFILSDFGLSKLKTGETSRTRFRVGQGFYLAPECESATDGFSKEFVSRASDVWSFGCILLETVVFMTGGGTALAKFREQRIIKNGFFTTRTFFVDQIINPAVEGQLCQLASSEILTVRQMVALIREILIMEPKKRSKASEVTLSLRLLTYRIFHHDVIEISQKVQWMFEDGDLKQQWNAYSRRSKDLVGDNDTLAGHSDVRKLKAFTHHAAWDDLVNVMSEVLELMQSSSSSATGQSQIATLLSRLNLLSELLPDERQAEIHSTVEQPAGETVNGDLQRNHRLPWETAGFAVKTSVFGNLSFSKDDNLVAVERKWRITVLTLPLGHLHSTIGMPASFRSVQPHFKRLRPSFEFSPDSKWLIVSWVKFVYAYDMKHKNCKGNLVFTILSETSSGGWSLAYPYGVSQIPIRIAAITPDSKYVALILQASKVDDNGSWMEQLSIQTLPSNEPDEIEPFPLLGTDHTFCFSPDSRLIAIGCQKNNS